MDSTPLTALQIARALGKTKQSVAKALGGVAHSTVEVAGKETNAWHFETLPRRIQRELTAAQTRGGYRSVSALIANPPRRWSLPCSIDAIPAACRQKAEQLREALRSILERKDNPLMSDVDLRKAGLAAYERVFGYVISERQWSSLLQRTIERDGGFEDWNRLDLYVDDRPVRPVGPVPGVRSEHLEELSVTLSAIGDRTKPSAAEKDAVWFTVVEILRRPAATEDRRMIKRQVIEFLATEAPWIGRSQNAIRANVDRKLARAGSAPDPALALRDGRSLRAAAIQAVGIWPKEDVDLIVGAAVFRHGGRVSEAIRSLALANQLSPESSGRLSGAGASKSYVPQTLRERVTPLVESMMPHHQGPRAARLVTPYIDRDYSKLASMDQIQADDFTLPVYFYLPDSNGGFRMTRGQCLVSIDVRSLRILSWVLIPAEQYTALSIRTLFARTFEEHGLPKRLYLEQGIWRRSKIVAGEVRNQEAGVPPLEMEMGLRGLGVEFTHAQRPQAKVVEKIGDLIQNRMHADPGYCGRDERRDCPEQTRRALQAVNARRAHPAEHFHSFEDWDRRLGVIFREYNAERHGSDTKIIPGLSPDEAFQKYWPDPGPSRIGPEARHLLAHIRKPAQCRASGISFEISGERFRYFGEECGKRQGQQLLAWFNPDMPETCTFTNLRGRDPFTAERHVAVSADGGDPQLETEIGKARAHARAVRSRYTVIKAQFNQRFTVPLSDRPTAELGQHLAKANVNARDDQAESHRRAAKIESLSRRTGVRTPLQDERTARALEGLDELMDGVKATALKGDV